MSILRSQSVTIYDETDAQGFDSEEKALITHADLLYSKNVQIQGNIIY